MEPNRDTPHTYLAGQWPHTKLVTWEPVGWLLGVQRGRQCNDGEQGPVQIWVIFFYNSNRFSSAITAALNEPGYSLSNVTRVILKIDGVGHRLGQMPLHWQKFVTE